MPEGPGSESRPPRRERTRSSATESSAEDSAATHRPCGAIDGDSGEGETWRRFEATLGRAALSDATLLLVGESGVGKSRAARRAHEWGPRSAGPVVFVQLSGLASSLIDAELFGHEEGAFTGARSARPGRFVTAQRGTIVLEGIETLAHELQIKLLRVLQERVVEPLGAPAPVPIDVRVIATSAVDLAAEVAAGRFRQDLYYRLAVLSLEVPPLRVRRQGLAALAREVGQQVAARLGVAPRELDASALERLATHPWPGNVRELENALERALVLAPSAADDSEDATLKAGAFDFLAEGLSGAAEGLARSALALGLGVEDVLDALADEALREERGNVTAAARRLGITRRTLELRLARRK